MNIISEKTVTTRKRHQCNACHRMIDPGNRMYTQVNTYSGNIDTWRTCITCTELIEKYRSRFETDGDWCTTGCVSDELNVGQIPEDLLKELNVESRTIITTT